ncbi:hypothetical protein BH18ACT17_BH18ACT17_03360 [soil metagenome]
MGFVFQHYALFRHMAVAQNVEFGLLVRKLLPDEPFGALDAKVRQDLRQWLDELHREVGVTSLLVTHDQEEALELASQVVVMREVAVEQVGTPIEIFDDPATPFVAGFVGAASVLHGVVDDGRVHLGAFRLPGAEHLVEGGCGDRVRAAARRAHLTERFERSRRRARSCGAHLLARLARATHDPPRW